MVDASLVVDWVAPRGDLASPALDELSRLVGAGDALLAPSLLWQEVGNALLTGVRRQRWSGAEADQSARRLLRLPVRRVDAPVDLERAYELSRRHDNHPIYDMVYVALALRLATEMITQDRRLAQLLGDPEWLLLPLGGRAQG
ncbi:MAG: type II toxin-antitoxin system VapC family toxin [Candidatus Dormiibacterota bacterium]